MSGEFAFPTSDPALSLCLICRSSGPGTSWVQLKGVLVTALSVELGSAGSHCMHVLICDYAHLFLLCCKRRRKHKPRLIVCIPPGWRLRKACSHTLVPLIPACPGSGGDPKEVRQQEGWEHTSVVTRGSGSPTPSVTSPRHGRKYSPMILLSVLHRPCCAGSAAAECFHSSALQKKRDISVSAEKFILTLSAAAWQGF